MAFFILSVSITKTDLTSIATFLWAWHKQTILSQLEVSRCTTQRLVCFRKCNHALTCPNTLFQNGLSCYNWWSFIISSLTCLLSEERTYQVPQTRVGLWQLLSWSAWTSQHLAALKHFLRASLSIVTQKLHVWFKNTHFKHLTNKHTEGTLPLRISGSQ